MVHRWLIKQNITVNLIGLSILETAEGSVAALVDFIKCYPEYKNR